MHNKFQSDNIKKKSHVTLTFEGIQVNMQYRVSLPISSKICTLAPWILSHIFNSLQFGKLFCHLWIFFLKLTFSKKSFRNTIKVSNSLDPDQAQHFVGPDLGPNCSQRLSADDKSPLVGKELIIQYL